MKKNIEKIELTREIKVLFLQILKTGSINVKQADQLTDYFCDNGLIEKIAINFVDCSGIKSD